MSPHSQLYVHFQIGTAHPYLSKPAPILSPGLGDATRPRAGADVERGTTHRRLTVHILGRPGWRPFWYASIRMGCSQSPVRAIKVARQGLRGPANCLEHQMNRRTTRFNLAQMLGCLTRRGPIARRDCDQYVIRAAWRLGVPVGPRRETAPPRVGHTLDSTVRARLSSGPCSHRGWASH